MKEALEKSVPAELFEVYETVIEAINRSNDDSQELAQKILSWLYYAMRPLRIAELREAIAVVEGDLALDEDDLLPPDDIVEVCRSLVSYDPSSGVVGFSHEKVQDFLRERYSHWLLPESDIAKTCIAYLTFNFFNLGLCGDENSLNERLQRNPFAEYAARNWGLHVRQARVQDDLEVQQKVFQIWQSRNRADAIAQIFHCRSVNDWELSDVFRGETVLHALASHNLTKMAKVMLDRESFERLGVAGTLDSDSTLKSHAQVVAAQTDGGASPLVPALMHGDIDMVDLLLNAKIGVGTTLSKKITALHIATLNQNTNVVERLLRAGSMPRATVDLAETTEGANYYEEINVNALCFGGTTALHFASGDGCIDILNLLLAANAKIDSQGEDGFTALHIASSKGHAEIVKNLLAAGANVTIQTKEGKAAIHLAENPAVLKQLIIVTGVDWRSSQEWTALHFAAREGRMDLLNCLLEAGADVASKTVEGFTPLQLAAYNGHVDIAQRLIEVKPEMSPDIWGATPLHKAAENGHHHALQPLIDAGAEIEASDNQGLTALHLASLGGHLEVTQRLLQAGAIAGPRDTEGFTPLHLASREGHLQIVDVLLDSKSSPNSESVYGITALHLASLTGRSEVVDKLLPVVENINCQDKTGWTPLHCACQAGHMDVIEQLIKAHANLNIQTILAKETPLCLASRFGHLLIVKELLHAEADDSLISSTGATAFGIASISGHLEIARLLVIKANSRRGPPDDDINRKSFAGMSHLELAIYMNQQFPRDLAARRALSYVYFAEKKYQEAIESFEVTIGLDCRNANISCVDDIIDDCTCDSCNMRPIRGYRHKCKQCEDYDLCHQCFLTNDPHPHPEHDFLTIPSEQWVRERFKTESD